MYVRYFSVVFLLVALALNVRADIAPAPQPRPINNVPPKPIDFMPAPPKAALRLVISRDSFAETGNLVLPAKLSAAMKPAESPRLASAFPNTIVGLALVGSLIAGGLWLARKPRSKYLLGLMLPLPGFALVGASVQAQPARTEMARGVIETGKVRISRDANATTVRLVLPKRAAVKS